MATGSTIVVKQQLQGRRIMITGPTGFLGKVVLEKIMRDIPDVARIILLIRGNGKYRTARERFEKEIATSSVFDRMREDKPFHFQRFCREKIKCVTAEVTEKHLGMNADDYAELTAGIDLVIHSAACVDFREPLDLSLEINALSLLNITDLVKAAGNIPLIHVSTCYVNGFNKGDCREEVVVPVRRAVHRNERGYYEAGPLVAKLQRKIEKVKNSCSDAAILSARLSEIGVKESQRHGWNDTYTFTKWIGEQLAMEALRDGTLTIVRPSIIESTCREPVAGWIEGVKVADAIILAYAREKTTFFPARPKGIMDIIPADLVANSLILAAAEALAQPGQTRIYQCATGSTNPITIGRMISNLQAEANRNSAAYDRLLPRGRPTRDFRTVNRGLFVAAMSLLKVTMLSYDRVCRVLGMKNRYHRIVDFVKTTMKLSVTFSFYGAPRYCFHNTKLMDLASRVTDEDRRLFPVDGRMIQWERYMGPIHLAGLNRYALKDRSAVQAPAETAAKITAPTRGEIGLKYA